jgi:hypothetical protein
LIDTIIDKDNVEEVDAALKVILLHKEDANR